MHNTLEEIATWVRTVELPGTQSQQPETETFYEDDTTQEESPRTQKTRYHQGRKVVEAYLTPPPTPPPVALLVQGEVNNEDMTNMSNQSTSMTSPWAAAFMAGTESGHIGQHEGKPIDKAQVKRLLSKGIKPYRNQLPPLPTAYSKLEDHPLYDMFKEAEKTHLRSHQQMKSWTEVQASPVKRAGHQILDSPLIGSYQPSTAATNLHVTQYRQAIGDDSAEAPAYVPVRPSDLATNAKTSYKEDIDYYRIQLEEFKILNQRYQQERTGLGKLTEHIRKTVSQHLFYNCCKAGLSHRQWIENLAANVGIDTKEELKRARERYLAAQKPMRLLAQWETWLTEMDHAITEGKALGIPECQDEEFIKEDFVKAVLKPSPEWTTAFMAGGNKDPRVTVRMMIKQFREYASLLHPIKHKVPKAAFVASRPQLNGEDADNAAEKAPGKRGRGKSRRTPGPGKDRKQCKVCDQQHELKNCWYAFPHNAPVWWKPRETLKTMAQHRIDSDTDLEQEIRGAKRAKLGTPQIKKSQSTPVEDTVE
ncbi:hypothetical protein PtrV1_06746 [Pyrenophora tritici-repentis]|nr:hypothetical protein PtrV1_06746 [Pyrenophora tritici-repentis]